MSKNIYFIHAVLFSLMLTLYLQQSEPVRTVQSIPKAEHQPTTFVNSEETDIDRSSVLHTENKQVKPKQDMEVMDRDDATHAKVSNVPNQVKFASFEKTTREFPAEPTDLVRLSADDLDRGFYACNGQAVHVMSGDTQLTLSGECSYLRISGPDSHIIADKVRVLDVIAPDTKVEVNAVDFVKVSGPDSHVYYRRTLYSEDGISKRIYGPDASVKQR